MCICIYIYIYIFTHVYIYIYMFYASAPRAPPRRAGQAGAPSAFELSSPHIHTYILTYIHTSN